MRLLILIASLWALVSAKPEMYKESEDFQYSRSSTDEGTKSGFYGAQRGNMGGNYEKAHNMDSMAQHHLSTLVRQVDGELGEGANTKTGSVFTAGNSRGIYGSGHYDLSNLKGRNFGENGGYEDSQSQSSLYQNARNQGNSYYTSNAGYGSEQSHSSNQRSGYSSSNLEAQYSKSNLESENKYHGASNYDYGALGGTNTRYYSLDNSQARRAYDQSNTNLHSSYDLSNQNRLTSVTPVKVYIRPGGRVAVPISAPSYTLYSSNLQDKNVADTTKVLSNSGSEIVYKPTNNAKHYESAYTYHKQWEKHNTQPLVVVPTENPFPANSELYEDRQDQTGQRYQSELDSSNTHLSNSDNGYSAHQNYQSGAAYANAQSSKAQSSNSAYSSGYSANTKTATASQARYQSAAQNKADSANSNTYSFDTHNLGSSAANINNLVEDFHSRPKNYHSSYSYHKAWERRGDPYVITPTGDIDGQTSQKLTSQNQGQFSSQQYGSHYNQKSYTNVDCDALCHQRKKRSYSINQYEQNVNDRDVNLGQQSEDEWDLGQQTENKFDNLEDLGQATQNTWDNMEDLGQQSHNQWNNLQNLGQETLNKWNHLEDNLGQQTQNNWDHLTEFGQQAQSEWSNQDDLRQQTENQKTQLENFGQETQNHFSNIEDLGQQTQGDWSKLADLGQQTQSQWGDFGHETQSKMDNLGQETQNGWNTLGQQSQSQWGKLEDLGQQTQSQWGQLEDLGQQTQNQWGKLEDLGQQTQSQWGKLEDLGQQTQTNWGKEKDFGQIHTGDLEDKKHTQTTPNNNIIINQQEKIHNVESTEPAKKFLWDIIDQIHEEPAETENNNGIVKNSESLLNHEQVFEIEKIPMDKQSKNYQLSQSNKNEQTISTTPNNKNPESSTDSLLHSKPKDVPEKHNHGNALTNPFEIWQNQMNNLGHQSEKEWSNLGQQSETQWSNLGQQSETQWSNLGQQSETQWSNLGQQSETQWSNLGQQSETQWSNLGQQSENQWSNLGQQSENQWSNLGQQSENQWSNLGQQSETQWSNLGQQSETQWSNLGQQSETQWSNLGQQSETQWSNLGQQSETQWSNLGQQSENQWSNLGQQSENQWSNLGQQSETQWSNLGQQSETQWSNLGQQSENQWNNLGQQSETQWSNLGQQSENQWSNLGQQSETQWSNLGQQTQNVWNQVDQSQFVEGHNKTDFADKDKPKTEIEITHNIGDQNLKEFHEYFHQVHDDIHNSQTNIQKQLETKDTENVNENNKDLITKDSAHADNHNVEHLSHGLDITSSKLPNKTNTDLDTTNLKTSTAIPRLPANIGRGDIGSDDESYEFGAHIIDEQEKPNLIGYNLPSTTMKPKHNEHRKPYDNVLINPTVYKIPVIKESESEKPKIVTSPLQNFEEQNEDQQQFEQQNVDFEQTQEQLSVLPVNPDFKTVDSPSQKRVQVLENVPLEKIIEKNDLSVSKHNGFVEQETKSEIENLQSATKKQIKIETPLEPTTEKPGFWGSVWNKTKNAKSSIVSWFKN